MPPVNTVIGKNLYLEYDGVEVTADIVSFDPGNSEEVGDASTHGSSLMVYDSVGIEKVEPKAKLVWRTGAASDALLAVLEQGHEGALVWGFRGNGAGMPKWGIDARVTKHNPPVDHKSIVEIDIEWVNRGDNWLFDGRNDTF